MGKDKMGRCHKGPRVERKMDGGHDNPNSPPFPARGGVTTRTGSARETGGRDQVPRLGITLRNGKLSQTGTKDLNLGVSPRKFCSIFSLTSPWEEAVGDGDTQVEVGSWEPVLSPPCGTSRKHSGAGQGGHRGLGILCGRQGLFLPF